eukprot:TRINITY_DN8113_c0_g1_i1.p1 TRINITY_DN8113_c0_g1~~TRINITY_DN8113_c0_g1_i1.p1  ORF type:complete len:366 (+),score=63.90 TRINITY_DN8113_c0_g1_i1:57-1100(+)
MWARLCVGQRFFRRGQAYCTVAPDTKTKEFLIIVNPFSGLKNGLKMAQEAQSRLEKEGLKSSMMITKYPKHASEIARTTDLCSFSGIVSVGGDGLVHEIVNGLVNHVDLKEKALEIPIGIIPAGSGNALANSLKIYTLDDAMRHILQKHTQPLDLMLVNLPNISLLSFCVVSWGLHARTVVDAERLRFMNARRFWISAIGNLLFTSPHVANLKLFRARKFPNFDSEEDVEFSSRLRYFLATKMKEISLGFPIAPHAKLSDGAIDVVMLKDCPTSQVWKFLASVPGIKHVQLPHTNYYKVKGFSLEFTTSNSPVCVDGEFYEISKNDRLEVKVEPSLRAQLLYLGQQE